MEPSEKAAQQLNCTLVAETFNWQVHKKKTLFLVALLSGSLQAFKLGVENLGPELLKQLKNKRVGFITNQTGITQKLKRSIDALLELGLNITGIYTPEHGLSGLMEAEEAIDDGIDHATGIPLISLYEGEKTNTQFPTVDTSPVDLFIYDMQGCGMRHYTYMSVMYHTMAIAARDHKPFIVLDRPNPLGPVMEGPVTEPDLLHFVAIAPIPLRHGLTIGELALYFNKALLNNTVNLTVIPMDDYSRKNGFNGQFLTFLSPNIASIDSCFGYCFGCILDNMRPFDVALNTPEAFQHIVLPERLVQKKQINFEQLKAICAKNNITVLKDTHWTSTPFTSEPVVGFKFKINDINTVSCSNFLWDLVGWVQQYELEFQYRPLIDHITGTKLFTKMLENKISKDSLAHKTNTELIRFSENIQDCLLYQPAPKVIVISCS